MTSVIYETDSNLTNRQNGAMNFESMWSKHPFSPTYSETSIRKWKSALQIGGNDLFSGICTNFKPTSTAYGAIISTYVSNQRYNLIKMFWTTLMLSHHNTHVRSIFFNWKSFTMEENKYLRIHFDAAHAEKFAWQYYSNNLIHNAIRYLRHRISAEWDWPPTRLRQLS